MHIHGDDRLRETQQVLTDVCLYTPSHPHSPLLLSSVWVLCSLSHLLSMKGTQTHTTQARMNTGKVAFDQGRIRLSSKGRTRVANRERCHQSSH